LKPSAEALNARVSEVSAVVAAAPASAPKPIASVIRWLRLPSRRVWAACTTLPGAAAS